MGCNHGSSGCELVTSFLHPIPQWKMKVNTKREVSRHGPSLLLPPTLSSAAQFSVTWSCVLTHRQKKILFEWECWKSISHTCTHTHAHVHTHIRAHRIFWFWLYTPFVQLGFRYLSLMSFWMKHNLYQMNEACEWILQAAWLHISLYPLKYPFASSSLHPIFCVFCLVCWTGLDWTCALFSHCDRHNPHCEPFVDQLHH